jgi:hypothetical protein
MARPMADNTIQFRWITVIYYNLAWLFAQDNQRFCGGRFAVVSSGKEE